MSRCRCGWDGLDEHTCHAVGYTCGKPAKQRWYRLADDFIFFVYSNMKFSLKETYACDECWEGYKKYLSGESNPINKLGEASFTPTLPNELYKNTGHGDDDDN